MLLLVLLCGACALLVRANTTDTQQLGVLGPRDDLLPVLLRKMEKMEVGLIHKMEKMEVDLIHKMEVDLIHKMEKMEVDLIHKMEKMEVDLIHKMEKMEVDRAKDKQELLRAIGEVSDAVGEVSDAVVSAATSDRVYACARAAAVLLSTPWADRAGSMLCSAFPLFSTQPQASNSTQQQSSNSTLLSHQCALLWGHSP